ncbi:polyprenyl synthetase family protein [Parabacteroides sp. OttesenSCG-928-N08]|nr:polyprenyl synthetase family protein [Parabacteroides sp. OttesenSCG-928-N08]
MDIRQQIENPVAEEFRRFNDDFYQSLKSSTNRLEQAIEVVMRSSGKHVRPLLVLLTAKACGSISDQTINSAVLLELLHTATLIHDDVVDDTKMRRGLPSLNAIFDNRIAVLVGDYILSTALVRSIQTGDMRIIQIISQLGRDLSEGEIKQLETAEMQAIDESLYFDVIKKKTATLLSACTQIGALSSGAFDGRIEVCKEFGEYLGYCFQLKDDIFDYYSDKQIGKPTGNDLREGKITLPLIYALQHAPEEEAAPCRAIIESNDFSDDNIATLIQFAIKHNGIVYAEQRMAEFRAKAELLIHQLPKSDARTALLTLADYIIHRKN